MSINDKLRVQLKGMEKKINAYSVAIKKIINEVETTYHTKVKKILKQYTQEHLLIITEDLKNSIFEQFALEKDNNIELDIEKNLLVIQLEKTLLNETNGYEINRTLHRCLENMLILKKRAEASLQETQQNQKKLEKIITELKQIRIQEHLISSHEHSIDKKIKAIMQQNLHKHQLGETWESTYSLICKLRKHHQQTKEIIISSKNTSSIAKYYDQILHEEVKIVEHLLDDIQRKIDQKNKAVNE